MDWLTSLDSATVSGRVLLTLAVVLAGAAVSETAGWVVARNVAEAQPRYWIRKAVRAVAALVVLVVVAVIWRAFAGRVGVVLGLATAGLAFAMQEVIGAFAGGMNTFLGRIFTVGDRIEMSGVRGDVIDVTPLRTKIMEIGSAADDQAWVKGRQYTGRVVAISNKATFTDPVYNYSAGFEYLWDEVAVGIPYDADIAKAESIMLEEAQQLSRSGDAQAAINAMARRYPIPRADVEPRVFVRSSDSWIEVSARFVVPLRSARLSKDRFTRRVLGRLSEAGIAIAYPTQETIVRLGPPDEDRADA